MALRIISSSIVSLFLFIACPAFSAPPPRPPSTGKCQRATLEGELNAGKPFSKTLGDGLQIYFQPIHSGWILRVLPQSGISGDLDYAEVATPPYQSVTALSISTDFAFRSQDAVGWNPRRFHFANDAASFRTLTGFYAKVLAAGTSNLPDAVGGELAHALSRTSEGTFSILDSRLVPGTADQSPMAAAVASHFTSTAHSLAEEPDGQTSALGRLLWLRFRVQMSLPPGFHAVSGWRLEARTCEKP